jgi:hypothetical protein
VLTFSVLVLIDHQSQNAVMVGGCCGMPLYMQGFLAPPRTFLSFFLVVQLREVIFSGGGASLDADWLKT